MTQFKNIALNIFLSFILIFIIFFLFKSGILKDYIVGGPLKDFFIDFKLGFIRLFRMLQIRFVILKLFKKSKMNLVGLLNTEN